MILKRPVLIPHVNGEDIDQCNDTLNNTQYFFLYVVISY